MEYDRFEDSLMISIILCVRSVLFPHLEELFRLLDDDRKKDPVGRMFCLWAVVVAVGNVALCVFG